MLFLIFFSAISKIKYNFFYDPVPIEFIDGCTINRPSLLPTSIRSTNWLLQLPCGCEILGKSSHVRVNYYLGDYVSSSLFIFVTHYWYENAPTVNRFVHFSLPPFSNLPPITKSIAPSVQYTANSQCSAICACEFFKFFLSLILATLQSCCQLVLSTLIDCFRQTAAIQTERAQNIKQNSCN